MSFEDEFQIYDSVSIDALEKGDLISLDGDFIEVHQIEDLLKIKILGYSYNEDDDVEIPNLEPDLMVNLYKIV